MGPSLVRLIGLGAVPLSSEQNPARELANKRWRDPEMVRQRIESLAADIEQKLDRLPSLTDDQKQRLNAIINGS